MGRFPKDEKVTRTRKKKVNRGDWGGFITCEMGKQERKDFLVYCKKNTEPLADVILTLVDADVNFSIAWTDQDEAYLAKATMISESDGKRYMLTAFHSDLEVAIRLLEYKHKVLLDGNWFDRPSDDESEAPWG